MAERACNGVVEFGTAPQIVGELRGWDYNGTPDVLEASIMGACVKRQVFGAVEYAGSLRMYFDHADAAQLLLKPNAVDTLSIKPQGTGSTLPQITGTARIGGFRKTGEVNGLIEFDADYSFETVPDETDQV